ncbi:serine/threonine protein kinase [Myxococcus stipitatus DSM 14675]|uniref:Serine/threonine protein kinase n=1 Tax=Myxococcus stipitatus (strain DSM 14675 / JCM 12634 / Mx s8) TaxID=1278073 RepID=L7U191_MYXSD|nr:serine/threonine-protein kinase [Myxococcus stipitatus]AGC41938.1 serine/threonine protein kinase [Myxococcus stipitatus DSM 14675]
MTGEVLSGRYRLERELGRGGMATVFLATDLRLSRPVALKRMHPGGGAGRAERFRREAELAASLRHPNVLEVHDYGEDGAHGPFLVCEWVRGEDLRALAGRLAPVPPEAAMVLAWELARALAAAHAVGIVHRDVKPENVLVAEGGPLKLADFGLAALEDQERLTSTGAVTGSLPYMAPERIDTGAYSSASDVYAVGVILFELCSGATPHSGKGAAHLAASVMTKDAPSLTEEVPGTPEPLAVLVAGCLARDARDRPKDGAALASALEELLLKRVGPPAEVAREFFGNPVAVAAKWRRGRFERLLEEGRGLLARGEGARAAKVLNTALVLEPGSTEVLALLREGPKRSRSKGGVLAAGLAGCAVVGWGGWMLVSSEGLNAGPVSPAAMRKPVGVEEAGNPRPDAVKGPPGGVGETGEEGRSPEIMAASGSTAPVDSRQPASAGGAPTHGQDVVATRVAKSGGGAPADSYQRGVEGRVPTSAGTVVAPGDSQQRGVAGRVPTSAGTVVAPGDSQQRGVAGRAPTDEQAAASGGMAVAAPVDSRERGVSGRAPTDALTVASAGAVGGAPGDSRQHAPSEMPAGSFKVPASGSTGSEARDRTKDAGLKSDSAKLPPASVSGTAPSAAPAREESAKPAVLKVTSRPWAEVFVNGESRGYTPRVRELSLPPGTHRLRFVNPLCDEVEVAVTLAAGETVARDVVLTLRKAEVSIQAPVGARLFVDGREVGTAPLPGPVSLEHGKHRVSAHLPGATPVQREVEVVAGRRLEVSLEVTP